MTVLDGVNRPTLTELYERHTGKVSDKWGNYLAEYDRIFAPSRDEPVSILEIGVQNGGSLEVWAEYFENARAIVGCDVDPACGELTFDDPRIKIAIGDAAVAGTASAILELAPALDIVIDDGSHRANDIVRAFSRFFPHLSSGGQYVIEDLHTSYWSEYGGGLHAPFSPMTFLKHLADAINQEHWGLPAPANEILAGFETELGITLPDDVVTSVHSVELLNSLAVVRKIVPEENRLRRRWVVGTETPVDPRPLERLTQREGARDQSTNRWSVRIRPPEEDVSALQRDLDTSRAEIEALQETLAERERVPARESARADEMLDAVGELEWLGRANRAEVARVRGARSWRVMRPIRAIGAIGGRIGGPLVVGSAVRIARRQGLRAAARLLRERYVLQAAKVFDSTFYRTQYGDVAATHMDPAMHYVLYGAAERRQPNAVFETAWYLDNNADVRRTGMNPLAHYVRFGAREGRDPSPRFSTLAYLAANPDVAAANVNPLSHFLRFGIAEGRPLRPQDEDSGVAGRARSSHSGVRGAVERFTRRRSGIRGYRDWIAANDTLTNADRAEIRDHIRGLRTAPLFSIVMPVFNGAEGPLREAIDSIRRQLYEHWELCIADDASQGARPRRILEEYARRDPRIKVTFRETTGGISAASNTALSMATGDWIALVDHDDTIAEHALYLVAETLERRPGTTIVYSDEDHIDARGSRLKPYFKPDWDYDLFLGQNLISHLGVYRADLVKQVGGFREGFEGSQDWDLALRVLEEAAADARVEHIPFVLYHWRQTSGAFSQRSIGRARKSAAKAVGEHLARTGQQGELGSEGHSSYQRVRRSSSDRPLVSIVIPTKDRSDLLRTCLDGLLHRTDYSPMELVIVDNDTTETAALALLHEMAERPDVRVVREPGEFNFSRLVNCGVAASSGTVCVLLNNDIDVIEPNWLTELVIHAMRPEVGAVGAKLYYADDTIQHAGVVVGLGGVAGHPYRTLSRAEPGYFGQLNLTHNVSATTAACVAIRREVYGQAGGFNDKDLPVAFNDVDFCLRLREAGFNVVWTPHAELYHLESVSRGREDSPEKAARFKRETEYMRTVWSDAMYHDPFYNPNLDLTHAYELAEHPRLRKPWLQATESISEAIPLPTTHAPYTVSSTSDRLVARPVRRVLVVGHSAAGKSRLARLANLDRAVTDFDVFAMLRGGTPPDRSALDMFDDFIDSEGRFLIVPNDRDVLNALAGPSRERFDDVAVIYLKRPQKLIEERLRLVNEDGASHRQLDDEAMSQYYASNDRMYRAAADYIFEYDGADVDDILWGFQALVGELRSDRASALGVSDKLNLFHEYLAVAYGGATYAPPSASQMAEMTAGGYQVFDTSEFPPLPAVGTTAAQKLVDLRWGRDDFESMRVTELGSQLGFFAFTAASLGASSVIGTDVNPTFVSAANRIAAQYKRTQGWPDDRVMFRTQRLEVGQPIIGDPDIIIVNAIIHWFIIQNPNITIEDVLVWLRDAANKGVYFEGCVSAEEEIMRQHGVPLERYSEELFLKAGERVFREQQFIGRCTYHPKRIVVRWLK